ncbi:helix-turn-helix domain-containing protein [Burkholderia seminalis]|uniref:helix-turn-helix domain-containing protein n=1 Tax=Burkholderia seminalis TaxID=488731 RepID=UPI000F59EF84|nr:helix-turn-helix domain-containing protein [Burkholderia seminalis]RQS88049.1 helix-turn-helix domain-containing protein [Burkholderia seminalis]
MKTAKELVDELSADGLTQAQISQATGVTQPTISRIQSGQSDGRSSTWKNIAALHEQRFGIDGSATSLHESTSQ